VKGKLATVLFCLVFAIPFGGIGVGASWVVVKMIQDGNRAQQWVRTKATLDSYGRGAVRYHYKFGENTYSGDRLGANPIGGTDNIDSWHADMRQMLSEAKNGSKPLMVWVNPDNPAESMVDRTIRWKLLIFALPFALGFGGVGVGALYVLVKTVFSGASPPGTGRAAAPSGLASTWIFTLMWNVIAFPIALIVVPDAVGQGEYWVLFVLLFPLIGVLLLWGAISATMTAIKNSFKRAFTPKPTSFQQPVATPPPAPVRDGFARGMLDDPRAAAGSADGAGVIDTMDDGIPPPPDPDTAQWEKLAGKKLSAAERAQLDNMSPRMRQLTGKLAGWLARQKEESKN